MNARREINLTINGMHYAVTVEARRTLVDVIREDCGLTGTHIGCEHGVCGACTILLDGEPIRSCLMFAVQAHRRSLRTVEGLQRGEQLHPDTRGIHTPSRFAMWLLHTRLSNAGGRCAGKAS